MKGLNSAGLLLGVTATAVAVYATGGACCKPVTVIQNPPPGGGGPCTGTSASVCEQSPVSGTEGQLAGFPRHASCTNYSSAYLIVQLDCEFDDPANYCFIGYLPGSNNKTCCYVYDGANETVTYQSFDIFPCIGVCQ